MQTKKFLQNIAFSSELYFIKAVDLKKLSVEKVDFHLPYDDYTVVLFLSSDGVVSVIRGENILNHTPD
ncbi:MAG: hypothetical protein J6W96_06440, partial [Alphaproteobacteria bacterium]|nr:hypothetical protein [Alphaproteobacteria bacterium]